MIAFVYSRHMADNKVFFQHPDLMRALANHETVMQLMINTLNKAQHQTATAADSAAKRRSSVTSDPQEVGVEESKVINLRSYHRMLTADEGLCLKFDSWPV